MRYSIIIITILILNWVAMGSEPISQEQPWKVGKTIYEGYPLYLRLPTGLNYDKLKSSYPNLLIITHSFDKVMPDGLPELQYDLSLFDFDGYLVKYFDKNKQGQIVLVETFGGKRSYYFYTTALVKKEEIQETLTRKYPEYKINIFQKPDVEWKLIKQYSKEYRF